MDWYRPRKVKGSRPTRVRGLVLNAKRERVRGDGKDGKQEIDSRLVFCVKTVRHRRGGFYQGDRCHRAMAGAISTN